MSNGFTLELAAAAYSVNIVFIGATRHLRVCVEVCYSDECPNFEYEWEFDPEGAAKITPERAAALCVLLANYAAADTAAEAVFAADIAEEYGSCDDESETPYYNSFPEQTISAMVEAFFFGGAAVETS